jgi:RNA polymerase sigma-70 factor, ECF subfamily
VQLKLILEDIGAIWINLRGDRDIPDEPESVGLFAQTVLNGSWTPARTVEGALVLLYDQGRTRWGRPMIEEGQIAVRTHVRRDQPGPFQLQAAVQTGHVR